MNQIVAVVPCYKDAAELSELEKFSLRNTVSKLDGVAPVVLACSSEVDESGYRELLGSGFAVKRFDASHFRSIHTYNHLLKSLSFYRAFQEYAFMLIVQADVYIFRAEYDVFLEYDYVGAPWFSHVIPHLKCIHPGSDPYFVGNGGYSLRRIASFIRVLESDSPPIRGTGPILNHELSAFSEWPPAIPQSTGASSAKSSSTHASVVDRPSPERCNTKRSKPDVARGRTNRRSFGSAAATFAMSLAGSELSRYFWKTWDPSGAR